MFASKHRQYKLFPLVNQRVVPGLSRLSKSLCAFFLPYFRVWYRKSGCSWELSNFQLQLPSRILFFSAPMRTIWLCRWCDANILDREKVSFGKRVLFKMCMFREFGDSRDPQSVESERESNHSLDSREVREKLETLEWGKRWRIQASSTDSGEFRDLRDSTKIFCSRKLLVHQGLNSWGGFHSLGSACYVPVIHDQKRLCMSDKWGHHKRHYKRDITL